MDGKALCVYVTADMQSFVSGGHSTMNCGSGDQMLMTTMCVCVLVCVCVKERSVLDHAFGTFPLVTFDQARIITYPERITSTICCPVLLSAQRTSP